MSENPRQHPLLAKTTLLLFWLQIATLLIPLVQAPAYILTAVHIYLLFRLQVVDSHFRTAAFLEIAALAGRLMLHAVPEGIWTLLGTILVQGLNLLWAYFAFTAFSVALKEIDPALSEKWASVRNGYLIVRIITTIGIELFFCFTAVSSVILLVAAIAAFAVDALLLINYWKTYKTFRN